MSSQKIYGLYGLKHHIVEMGGGVTDAGQTTDSEDRATQPKWKLEAEFRNLMWYNNDGQRGALLDDDDRQMRWTK